MPGKGEVAQYDEGSRVPDAEEMGISEVHKSREVPKSEQTESIEADAGTGATLKRHIVGGQGSPSENLIKEVMVRHLLAKREQDHEIELLKEIVEQERVLRQVIEHRVDELEKEVSELRGHLSACQTMNKTVLKDMEVLREAQEKHQQELLQREDEHHCLAEEQDKVLRELKIKETNPQLQKPMDDREIELLCSPDLIAMESELERLTKKRASMVEEIQQGKCHADGHTRDIEVLGNCTDAKNEHVQQ
ncbi:arginine and glutamate-rich protein 1-like [Ranitomeya imitator]|uniref:arginine and glutamate-rich protein 1-like n=1 Tax=Ranitomeya imitator TaxID=111125 RepID=UPI0037E8711B